MNLFDNHTNNVKAILNSSLQVAGFYGMIFKFNQDNKYLGFIKNEHNWS